jgi:hypothetical protein
MTWRPVADRLWARVDTSAGTAACWLWPGATIHNGYGVIGLTRKRNGLVHRVAYESLIGPIPDGMHLHHECRNRLCVNPAHLRPLAQGEHNAMHATGKCRSGHDIATFGYFRKSGPREGEYVYCRACKTPGVVSHLLPISSGEIARVLARRAA